VLLGLRHRVQRLGAEDTCAAGLHAEAEVGQADRHSRGKAPRAPPVPCPLHISGVDEAGASWSRPQDASSPLRARQEPALTSGLRDDAASGAHLHLPPDRDWQPDDPLRHGDFPTPSRALTLASTRDHTRHKYSPTAFISIALRRARRDVKTGAAGSIPIPDHEPRRGIPGERLIDFTSTLSPSGSRR